MVLQNIEKKTAIPIYKQVYGFLQEDIAQGRYNNTGKLPAEPELAALYGVSRVTIRKMLSIFEKKGIIVKQKGKGTFIADEKNRINKKKLFRVICSDYEVISNKNKAPLNYFIITRLMNGIIRAMDYCDVLIDILSLAGLPNEQYYQSIINYNNTVPAGLLFIKTETPGLYNMLHNKKIPFVVIDSTYKMINAAPEYNLVCSNHAAGVAEAVSYLHESGRKKIGYIGILNEKNQAHNDRFKGYKKGLGECGITFNLKLTEESAGTESDGYQAAKRLLSREKNIDAVVCSTDIRAFGAMKALKDIGKKIPSDIAVIGFDNLNEAEFSTPSLASIDTRLADQGYAAAVMLAGAVKAGNYIPAIKIIEPKLIIRQSV